MRADLEEELIAALRAERQIVDARLEHGRLARGHLKHGQIATSPMTSPDPLIGRPAARSWPRFALPALALVAIVVGSLAINQRSSDTVGVDVVSAVDPAGEAAAGSASQGSASRAGIQAQIVPSYSVPSLPPAEPSSLSLMIVSVSSIDARYLIDEDAKLWLPADAGPDSFMIGAGIPGVADCMWRSLPTGSEAVVENESGVAELQVQLNPICGTETLKPGQPTRTAELLVLGDFDPTRIQDRLAHQTSGHGRGNDISGLAWPSETTIEVVDDPSTSMLTIEMATANGCVFRGVGLVEPTDRAGSDIVVVQLNEQCDAVDMPTPTAATGSAEELESPVDDGLLVRVVPSYSVPGLPPPNLHDLVATDLVSSNGTLRYSVDPDGLVLLPTTRPINARIFMFNSIMPGVPDCRWSTLPVGFDDLVDTADGISELPVPMQPICGRGAVTADLPTRSVEVKPVGPGQDLYLSQVPGPFPEYRQASGYELADDVVQVRHAGTVVEVFDVEWTTMLIVDVPVAPDRCPLQGIGLIEPGNRAASEIVEVHYFESC